MKITMDHLYRECDRELGSYLSTAGFRGAEPGEYLRTDDQGEERILVDPDKRKVGFSVLLSYYPDDMKVIEQLSDYSSEPRGFPCGPYLSPAGVGRREYLWSYKSPEALQSGLESVKAAVGSHGLRWLQGLRDPRTFANEVDQVAALYAAFAHERAGNTTAAKRLYEEMFRRLTAGLNLGVSEEEFLRTTGKKYIFVARKLGMDDERLERFSRELGGVPKVGPLGGS